MADNGRDYWRCFAGALFGFALALVWSLLGGGAFVLALLLTILGAAAGWFFGRILL